MSESQRTPGDWKVVNEGSAVFAGEQLVASVFGDAEFMTGPIALANARLIAAAPELLESLKTAMRQWSSYYSDRNSDDIDSGVNYESAAYLLCKAVILKAEGGAE